MNNRDLQLTIRQRFDQKQNIQSYKRVVITDAQGNQTGAGSIWANRTLRRVWYMAHGAAQPAQAYCSGAKIPNPQIGMRAFLGFAENSNEPELFEDPTLRKTNTTGQPVTITPEDLQPGGRYFLWIQSKAIQPLATFPTSNTGLKITIVAGYYPYGANRKYYGGVVGLSLAASVPTIGLKRKVGIYLDASNILQTVNGSTVATTAIAPDPTWPAGAFRLSMVTLEYGQTSIDFSTDIEDARMLFSDENGGGGGGWPFAKVLTVSTTDPDADYSTISAAITAASAGDAIFLDSETFTEAITINKNITIFGLGAAINSTTDAYTVTITSPCTVLYLGIRNGTNGALAAAVLVDGAISAILERCTISKSSGTPTIGAAIHTDGAIGLLLRNCIISASAGISRYGIYNDPAFSSIAIYGGSVFGTTNSIYGTEATSLLNLYNSPTLSGSVSFTSTDTTGFYNDSSGNLLALVGTGIISGVWLIDESATFKKKYSNLTTAISAAASSGDSIILETDTYSFSAQVTIGKSLTIEGNGPEATILDFNLANNACFDFTADNITVVFRNLTIDHSAGGSTAAGPLFTNNSGVKVILDNAIVKKSGGAPGTGYGAWWLAGTLELRNGSKLLCTSGTAKYGFLNDSSGDVTLIIGPGCEVGGATADVYSNRAGSTVNIYGGILTNSLISWSGTINAAAYTAAAALLMDDDNWIGLGSSAGRLAFNDTTVDELQVKSANLIIEDDKIIGLGPAAGRIEFDDQSTDEINFLDCVVGIGTSTPGSSYKLDVNGAMAVKQIVTTRFTLADDTATSIAVNPIGNRFTFFLDANGGEYFGGVDTYNAIATWNNSGCSVVASSVLSGTTGPDGTINLSDVNGLLYVENRRGGSRTIGVVKICSD